MIYAKKSVYYNSFLPNRPISILPILSIVFENHVNVCLTNFLTKNKAIHKLQAGFRTRHSCTDLVYKILSDVTDKKHEQIIIAMFLDLSKAFDCVDHQILYQKLKNFKIEGSLLQLLLKSFLVERRQFFGFSNQVSKVLPITVGVPQGSILASTQFLILDWQQEI